MQIVIDANRVEQLKLYSELIKKDINTILDEALEEYFVKIEKELLEKNLQAQNAETSLDYDEFWDGVDV